MSKRKYFNFYIKFKSIEDFKKFSPLEISESSSSNPFPLSFTDEEPKIINDWEIIEKTSDILSMEDSNKMPKYADLKVYNYNKSD